MKHLRNVLSCLTFLLLLAISLIRINEILEQKSLLINSNWPSTATYKQFYKTDRNSIEVLFLGSSVVANAFIPQEIYNEYGITSYNLAAEQQSLFLNYYWLKESLRYQTPKVVVLDLKFMCTLHPDDAINMEEGQIRKSIDSMRFSKVKYDAIKKICALDNNQSAISYLLTNIRYHGRWVELQEYDFNQEIMDNAPLYGYAPNVDKGPETYDAYTQHDKDIKMSFNPIMQEYLDKIVELCDENNINLLLIDLPGNEMNDAINNSHEEYAEKNGIDYCNLCNIDNFNELGANLPEENVVNHQNFKGAIITSRFIGSLIKDKYDIPPVVDSQFEDTKSFYKQTLNSLRLIDVNNISDYFNLINKDNYEIFISSYGDVSEVFNDEIRQEFAVLGLKTIKYLPEETSYVAVIDKGNVAWEEYSREKISFSASFRNENSIYTIESSGKDYYYESSINIDGDEFSRKGKGLNITVYDLNLCKVIDSVTINRDGVFR